MYMPTESFADSVSYISKPIAFLEVALSSVPQFFGHTASNGHFYMQRSKRMKNSSNVAAVSHPRSWFC